MGDPIEMYIYIYNRDMIDITSPIFGVVDPSPSGFFCAFCFAMGSMNPTNIHVINKPVLLYPPVN